jgi:phosphomannomutase
VEYVSGEGALWMNALAQRYATQFALQWDGLQAALAMLGTLARSRLTLRDWLRDMPTVSRRSRCVTVPPAQTGRILRAMARREQNVEFGGGMRFRRKDGWAWICPDEGRPRLRIVTEAASEEYARELCDFCETELKRIAAEKN